MGNQFVDILGALVTVALVTTIVSHPRSANVITAGGNAFSHSILASQGIK